MKSKIASVIVCLLFITSMSASVVQNVGQSDHEPISDGSGGLADSPCPMFRQNPNDPNTNPIEVNIENMALQESSPSLSDMMTWIESLDSDKRVYNVNENIRTTAVVRRGDDWMTVVWVGTLVLEVFDSSLILVYTEDLEVILPSGGAVRYHDSNFNLNDPGEYLIRATLYWDVGHLVDVKEIDITIIEETQIQPPLADVGPDQTVNEGDVVWLDGSNSKGSTTGSGQVWTKYVDNPVLDLGPPGSWDDAQVSAPDVIFNGTGYEMWYGGNPHAGYGDWEIGHATSPDGINWTRDPANPVLRRGTPGNWDDFSVAAPSVIYDGSGYQMWYGAADGSRIRIGYATSLDGWNWLKYGGNPVLNVGTSDQWDDRYVQSPSVIYNGSGYQMWFHGHDDSTYRIGYATSPDGVTWSKYGGNPVFNTGPPGTWNDAHVHTPEVIYEGTEYQMWFGGNDGTSNRIGFATSPDGITWSESEANPMLDLGPPGSWEATSVQSPSICTAGSMYYLWYTGYGGDYSEIGYAYPSACGGSEIVQYEWDFESDGIYDYQETSVNAPDGIFDGKATHIYGDNGIYTVNLRVTNDENLTDTDTCDITVLNIDPTVTIESVSMDVEIGLRVAGRKFNDAGMTLYEDGNLIGYISIERMPGSPDEQMAWIPLNVDFSKSYSATLTYIPEDPPNIGANPVWIYLKSQNGSIKKIHHTFNVQQSKKRDSNHWIHVEPWEVDLSAHFIGLPFVATSHVSDPGSDDENLTCTYGSQVVNVTYFNNPPDPDPYPSPEVKPVDIYNTTFLLYEGPGTINLTVTDDDGGNGSTFL